MSPQMAEVVPTFVEIKPLLSKENLDKLPLKLLFLFTILSCSCAYKHKVTRLLKENTLLYCVRDKEAMYQPLDEIIEIRGDSIYNGFSRCDSLQEWYHLIKISKDPSDLYVPFQIPYTLKRQGKRIVLHYKEKPEGAERQRTYVQDQYSLNRKDSVVCTDLNYLCNQEMGYSKFLGDTVITIANMKLRCLIFREYYLRSRYTATSRDLTMTRYLEKSTLAPIMIDGDFYEVAGFKTPNNQENAGYTILNSIIPRDSLKKNLVYKTKYCY